MCITRLASNEIFSPSKKLHREVGRAKDLSAPPYINHITTLKSLTIPPYQFSVKNCTAETKKIQIKLATTYNKNEKQDAKNIAELYTKWTKTTWKAFEEGIGRGRRGLWRPDSGRMMLAIVP
jgi:hypothetical protein